VCFSPLLTLSRSRELATVNKYSSGYTLCSLVSIFGVIVIVISTLCAFFFFFVYFSTDLPGGATVLGMGVVFLLFGFFQGITSLGIGAIGRALLDGSIAQQEVAQSIAALPVAAVSQLPPPSWNKPTEERSSTRAGSNSSSLRTDLKPFRPAGDMQAFKEEVYEGVKIRFYYQRGEYVVDEYSFYSQGDAKHYIKYRRASV
jgi:hypothetical protein